MGSKSSVEGEFRYLRNLEDDLHALTVDFWFNLQANIVPAHNQTLISLFDMDRKRELANLRIVNDTLIALSTSVIDLANNTIFNLTNRNAWHHLTI
jgi:hypothetical protein